MLKSTTAVVVQAIFLATLSCSGVCGVAAAQSTKPALVAAPRPQPDALTAPAAQPSTLVFPPVLASNFTVSAPSVETVNAFLRQLWGYDPLRQWSVQAIRRTDAPGVAKVEVLIADPRSPGKTLRTIFYTLPDGEHAIADQVIDFGAHPYEHNAKLLAAKATGPAQGATSKALELVEFGDLQCPHCKEAEDTMVNVAKEFPQAHIVWEDLPLVENHPYAFRAAAEGVCLRQAKGDAAFFTYQSAVFANQSDLTAAKVDATLASAITAAGGDPRDAAACAQTDLAKDAIQSSVELAHELGVTSTPTLFINGRAVPVSAVPFDTLKQLIAFQAAEAGVTVHLQPTLTTLP